MNMRDTTLEANERAEMQNFYLIHAESPDARWAVSIEQVTDDRFHVSVQYRDPAWDVYGTIRYWVAEDRAEAEARYLQLQGLFQEFDEGISVKTLLRRLPDEEAYWRTEEE